jgi:nitroreductase
MESKPKIKVIGNSEHIEYQKETYTPEECLKRSKEFYEWMDKRRTVRKFSDQPVPKQVIENIIKTASTAPSGAHKQPWTFCVVSDSNIKKEIRIAAEKEEYDSYNGRMSDEWIEDLKTFATDWHKPFLEIAPYLIIVFKKAYNLEPDGSRSNNYYVNESVGLACGMLLAAIHHAGLVALTHTPSPMNFLMKILKRPSNERPYLLIPVGYPTTDTYVPNINRKGYDEIAEEY